MYRIASARSFRSVGKGGFVLVFVVARRFILYMYI